HGDVLTQEEYYPFGGTAVWSAKHTSEAKYKYVRYSGKERDVTGLYHYGYRYYMPWMGRWLNPDPAWMVDGLNLYRMVRNNPITLIDDDGLVPIGAKQKNGLYEPQLRVGPQREVEGAQIVMPAQDSKTIFKLNAHPERLRDVLSKEALSHAPLLTDLINPQKVNLSSIDEQTLQHKQGGGKMMFGALKVVNNQSTYHALHVVNPQKPLITTGMNAELAYWTPQGGYVDIPTLPANGEPELVFTPGFSGCSFVVDQLDPKTLRVYHVQGNKENEEYNQRDNQHGEGLVEAMEYVDYGFHTDESGQVMENITGSAFMAFDRKDSAWGIHYQGIANTPAISAINETAPTFFNKKGKLQVTTQFSSSSKVSHLGSKSLR
ncbi:RHS repeat-associated core domain-containing protein, partial [Shewanella sp. YLB-07]|uniref:RHS repeat-associated core domain-containing protein n=1 Tax=Shewanella sp. YLB-07 TaxID=2601268 RepID=UPI0012CCD457